MFNSLVWKPSPAHHPFSMKITKKCLCHLCLIVTKASKRESLCSFQQILWRCPLFLDAGQICAVNGGEVQLPAQMAAPCEKGPSPCHCTSWKTEDDGDRYTVFNVIFLPRSAVSGAISSPKNQLKCRLMQSVNGQNLGSSVSERETSSKERRLLCVGSVSREE